MTEMNDIYKRRLLDRELKTQFILKRKIKNKTKNLEREKEGLIIEKEI